VRLPLAELTQAQVEADPIHHLPSAPELFEMEHIKLTEDLPKLDLKKGQIAYANKVRIIIPLFRYYHGKAVCKIIDRGPEDTVTSTNTVKAWTEHRWRKDYFLHPRIPEEIFPRKCHFCEQDSTLKTTIRVIHAGGEVHKVRHFFWECSTCQVEDVEGVLEPWCWESELSGFNA